MRRAAYTRPAGLPGLPTRSLPGHLGRDMQQDAVHMPLDVAEDVLCSGQRFRRGGAGIHPHGLQAGKDLSGCKGFTLPQYRLPQPGKQALLGPLLQKGSLPGFPSRASVTGCSLRGLGRCFAGQLQCSARSTGGAQVGKRAFFAQGRTVRRHADQPLPAP